MPEEERQRRLEALRALRVTARRSRGRGAEVPSEFNLPSSGSDNKLTMSEQWISELEKRDER